MYIHCTLASVESLKHQGQAEKKSHIFRWWKLKRHTNNTVIYLIGFRKGTSIITMTRILKGNLKQGVGEKKIYCQLSWQSRAMQELVILLVVRRTVVKSKKVRLINSVLYQRQTKYCWKPLFQLRLGVVNEQRFLQRIWLHR